jgi:hypothetical protein
MIKRDDHISKGIDTSQNDAATPELDQANSGEGNSADAQLKEALPEQETYAFYFIPAFVDTNALVTGTASDGDGTVEGVSSPTEATFQPRVKKVRLNPYADTFRPRVNEDEDEDRPIRSGDEDPNWGYGESCIITPNDVWWNGKVLPDGCVATLAEAQLAFGKEEGAAEATPTAKKLRLKDVQFQDSKGSHSRYGVRSMGRGNGFGIKDKLENRFLNIAAGSASRSDCDLALQNHEEDITP